MSSIGFVVFSSVFGLFFGSFAGATVWRLRARQLVADKKAGDKVDARELKRLKPLAESTVRTDRSRCLQCGHSLAWYDLVPLVSWLSTRGKCRYCRHKIGWFEPAIELGTAALFGLVSHWWATTHVTQPFALFVLWSIVMIGLVILFAYDLKWFLLPDAVVLPLIVIATIIVAVDITQAPDKFAALADIGYSLVIMSGIYAVVYYYSRWRYGEENTWIGFGDVKLGVILGLLLGQWELAFLALFLANSIGLIAVAPSLMKGKTGLKTRVPFGPLLISGFLIALMWGQAIINWYMSTMLLCVS